MSVASIALGTYPANATLADRPPLGARRAGKGFCF